MSLTTGSQEIVWNVFDGVDQPSPVYLNSTPFRNDYDTTKKTSAIAFARDLRDQGFTDVRVYRSATTRTFTAGYRRTTSVIEHTLVTF